MARAELSGACMRPDLPADAAPTLAAARRALTRAFRDAGIETPDLDARVLLQSVIGIDHAGLITAGERVLNGDERARLEAAAARRLGGEPVARIVGEKEFWGLPLRLAPATLVPRPDTETLVEAALAAVDAAGSRARPLTIADLGTGSGAILLALLSELPQAHGVGTDASVAALRTASGNARRLGFAARTAFVACDFGAALAGGFDIVVANPPYVESAAIASLPIDVRDHDPHLALDGGIDGLAAYRAIARDAARLLAPAGHIAVEIGAGQAADVTEILRAAALTVDGVRADLAGIPRAVLARR